MSWLITGKQYIPAVIGEPFGGGYFAGYISHTADGNPTHALIVAPRDSGATGTGYPTTTMYKWADETVEQPAHLANIGTSVFDGKYNTDLMMTLISNGTYSQGAFPAAKYCNDLSIGGFTDWYLPARSEADIAYFNLKPTTDFNDIGYGSNAYAVPTKSTNHTLTYPTRTEVPLFADSGEQAFVGGPFSRHWTSSAGGTVSTNIIMSNGNQGGNLKTVALRIRAFRRIAL